MKSIKINSKRADTTQPSATLKKTPQNNILFSNDSASLQTKCTQLLLELIQITQIKLSLNPETVKQIQNLSKQKQKQQDSKVLSKFRTLLLQLINQILEKYPKQSKSPTKIIRLKSQDAVKLRLLKQKQQLSQELQQKEHEKQEYAQNKIIHHLKQTNKKLEKKILLLGEQFNNIKNQYQIKIYKYKKMFNTTLAAIYKQIQQQPQAMQIQLIKNKSKKRIQGGQPGYATQRFSMNFYNGNQNRKINYETQNQEKFYTIPTIPNIQSAANSSTTPTRQFSHRTFEGVGQKFF